MLRNRKRLRSVVHSNDDDGHYAVYEDIGMP
jgi:hypothetical protein